MTDRAAGTAGQRMNWRVRIIVACLITARVAVMCLVRLRRLCYRAHWHGKADG